MSLRAIIQSFSKLLADISNPMYEYYLIYGIMLGRCVTTNNIKPATWVDCPSYSIFHCQNSFHDVELTARSALILFLSGSYFAASSVYRRTSNENRQHGIIQIGHSHGDPVGSAYCESLPTNDVVLDYFLFSVLVSCFCGCF